MRKIYKLFYRENGVRFANELADPKPFKLEALPKLSLLHLWSDEHSSPEIDVSQPYLKGYAKKTVFDYILDYSRPVGGFIRPTFEIKSLTTGWRRANKAQYEWIPEAYKTNSNMEVLLIQNYGWLDKLYKYRQNEFNPYYRWKNRWTTILDNVVKIAKVSERHQFLFFPIAKELHGRTVLNKFTQDGETIRMVKTLGHLDDSGFYLLDFWKWVGVTHRSKSLMNVIDPSLYSKINFVFRGRNGNDVVINLAWFNSWIKGQPNQTELGSVVTVAPHTAENLFLKLSMALNGMDFDEDNEEVEVKNPILTTPQTTIQAPEEPDQGEDIDEDDIDEAFRVDDQEETDDFSPPTLYVTPKSEKVKLVIPEEDPVEKEVRLDKSLMQSLEDDIKILDKLSLQKVQRLKENAPMHKASQADLEESFMIIPGDQFDQVKAEIGKAPPPAVKLKNRIEQMAEKDLLTAAEYRKLQKTIEAFEVSENPYQPNQKRSDAINIPEESKIILPEDKQIKAKGVIPDTRMLESAGTANGRKYVRKVLKPDILSTVDAIQNFDVVIKRHEVEVKHSVLGSIEQHVVELKPVNGQPSSVKFMLPVIDKDGTFRSGGSKYMLRMQRRDIVIRKIGPREVQLSTYYGKTFVQLSSKVVNDDLGWIKRQLNISAFSADGIVKHLSPGDVFDSQFDAPVLYNAIANSFDSFDAKGLSFNFDHVKREKGVNPALLRIIEKNGRRWCGWTEKKDPIVMDKDGNILIITKNAETNLGYLPEYLGFPMEKMPVNFAEVRLFSKYVPLGLVLGYYLGFNNLVTLLGAKYRVVLPRKNKQLTNDEYAISFKDVTYVFNRKDRHSAMVLAGFADYEKLIKEFEVHHFNAKDVYFNLLSGKGMGSLYMKELDNMEKGFVDPISLDILRSRGEPEDFKGLLIHSVKLLEQYQCPPPMSRKVMREAGYERLAGYVYKELAQAIRQFETRNVSGRSKIDISPFQIWNAIMKDNSIKIVEDTNPIQNLKESEVFTYSGIGGRDRDTMTKPTRAMDRDDVGFCSEASVDSSAVGTIAYLSANPQIKDVRGIAKDDVDLNPTTMLSTSALISPAALNDTPKRMMFVCTQHSHTIASEAYRQPYLRTGYEFVIGQRTSDLFSAAAEEDGKIVKMTDLGMTIQYVSGELVGIELGRRYGRAEGTIYPHDVYTPYKEGETFKKGDILAYNTKFFEPDFLDPKMIIMKINTAVNTAYLESESTHEDSAEITARMGQQFSTEVIKEKSIVVRFGQSISNMKKPGELVSPNDVLMTIEDEITTGLRFDEKAMDVLKRDSNISPKAGVLGIIERIEICYHGDKSDMTPSLKTIADKYDRDLAAKCKSTNKPVITGRVTEEWRVKGNPLELDFAEIRVYMAVTGSSGVGDKLVFSHQMKSTTSEVFNGEIHTEDGTPVDAKFSYRSVSARKVLSPAIIGTTISLLDIGSRKAGDIFLGQ